MQLISKIKLLFEKKYLKVGRSLTSKVIGNYKYNLQSQQALFAGGRGAWQDCESDDDG